MSTRIYNPAVKAPRLWAFGAWLRGVLQSGGFLFAIWMIVIAVVIQVLNFLIGFLQRDWSTILVVIPVAFAAIGIITALTSQRKPLFERYPDIVADAGELRGYTPRPNTPNDYLWEAIQHARAERSLRKELEGFRGVRLTKRERERVAKIMSLIPAHEEAARTALARREPSFTIPE